MKHWPNLFSIFALSISITAGPSQGASLFAPPTAIMNEAHSCGHHAQMAIDHHIFSPVNRRTCPVSAQLIEWLRLTYLPFPKLTELIQFLQADADWPLQAFLRKKVEEALKREMPASANEEFFLLDMFTKFPPVTGAGWIAYVRILSKMGQPARAHLLLRNAWRKVIFTNEDQALLLKEFKSLFNPDTTFVRCDYLLSNQRPDLVKSLLDELRPSTRVVIEARLEILASNNLQKTLKKLPATLIRQPGVTYERILWYVNHKQEDAAFKYFIAFPSSALPLYAKYLWKPRNLLVRELLIQKRYPEAYMLVRAHGLSKSEDYINAEWLAGWIALRFLKQPQTAEKHFSKLPTATTTPISQARAFFWLGECATALHNTAAATGWYKAGALHPATFYGQAAASRLKEISSLLVFHTPKIEAKLAERFYRHKAVLVLQLLYAIKRTTAMHLLFEALTQNITDPEELELLAEMAREYMGIYGGVWVTTQSKKRRIPLVAAAYPVLPSIMHAPLAAFIHAIIRQESRFHPEARSPKGAVGLMQLRPSTALELEKKYGLPHKHLFDVLHNIQLGTKQLEQLIHTYKGSLLLTTAVYNAGQRPVARWINIFGDPRTPAVNPIDWIELIPYSETRNYVQRVLEAFVVYRERFNLAPIDMIAVLRGQAF